MFKSNRKAIKMDIEILKISLNIMNVAITLWIWRSTERFKEHAATINAITRIEENSKRGLDELNQRVSALENELKHVPSKDNIKTEFEKIHEKVNSYNLAVIEKLTAIGKEVSEISGEFKFVKQAAQDLRRNELEKRQGYHEPTRN